jgi:hypothetical protein
VRGKEKEECPFVSTTMRKKCALREFGDFPQEQWILLDPQSICTPALTGYLAAYRTWSIPAGMGSGRIQRFKGAASSRDLMRNQAKTRSGEQINH